MGCDSPLKGYRDRDTGGIVFRKERSFGEKMEVACGQCLGCSLDYRRMWAMRIQHEGSLWEYKFGNCFVTLTYRDLEDCDYDQAKAGLHVPPDWSLQKSHFQKFMKRLRKWVFSKNGQGRVEEYDDEGRLVNGIKYFYAGEYGRRCKHGLDVGLGVGCPLCNVGRPHYHAILFNVSFDDLVAYASDDGIMRYTSESLDSLWGYGFVDVGELNFGSASYVAGYVLKKIRGVRALDHYMSIGMDGEITWLLPEFVGMSRGNAGHKGERCGIGAGWYNKFSPDMWRSGKVAVPGKGMVDGIPRYYLEILRDEDPELYEKLRQERLKYMRENKEEFSYSRLLQKHKCKKARVADEKRDL